MPPRRHGVEMRRPDEIMVDKVLRKYEIPEWVRPYVYDYVKADPANAVKKALSFVEIKRRKGMLTAKDVKLPNGITFDIKMVKRLLNTFFYAEESVAAMCGAWVDKPREYNAEYINHFTQTAESSMARARAIKSVIEGISGNTKDTLKEIDNVFGYVSTLESWPERVVALDFILRYAYAKTLGLVFYKVFYPVAPEFMRNIGKVFAKDEPCAVWGEQEATRIINEGIVPHERVNALCSDILSRVYSSIDDNMYIAKQSGVAREIALLRDVSVAYPLVRLEEIGVIEDARKEFKAIADSAAKKKG